jgi:NDP-sugar pyrophosphorylase family protein
MLTVAILAGGLATRLRPISNDIPKSLIDICGKPFIDWQLKLLSQNGIDKVVLCTSYKSEKIEEFVGDGSRYGIDVKYSKDGNMQLGTGGAIKKASQILEDEFMILYGDSYLPIDYMEVQSAFYATKKPALMTIYQNNGAFDSSNVAIESGLIKSYSKVRNNHEFTHIDFGLSVFTKSIFDSFKFDEKFDLSEIFTKLSNLGILGGFEIYERFYEVGSVRGIIDFTNYIKRSKNVI